MSPHSFRLTLIHIFLIVFGPFPSSSHLTLRCPVGQSVTLNCACRDENFAKCFWYKQEFGWKPVKMSSYFKPVSMGDLEGIFKGSNRFKLDNLNNLTILDLHISDTATYFCMRSDMDALEFAESFTLDVEGEGRGFKMLVAEVKQEESEVEEESLDCGFNNGVCGVHWFKPSGESATGVLYSREEGDSGQCERDTSRTRNSCVFNLPIFEKNVTRNWSKCAVASCGRALFGNKCDLSSEDKGVPSVLVLVLSGALLISLILSAFLVLTMFKIKKKTPPTATIENEEDIHYAALRHQSSNRPRRQANDNNTECVYSSVQL